MNRFSLVLYSNRPVYRKTTFIRLAKLKILIKFNANYSVQKDFIFYCKMGQRQKNSRYRIHIALCIVALLIITFLIKYQKSEIEINPNDIENWINNLDNPVNQDDPALVEWVRENFILRPHNSVKDTEPVAEPDYEVDRLEFVEVLYDNGLISDNVPGFFVEIGANDGKQWTCTSYFDQELHWNGLVVEPHPRALKKLLSSGRRLWYSNAAVSSTSHPSMANYHFNELIDLFGGLTYRYYKGTNLYTTLQAIPLYTLLLAIDAPETIDVLVLDTEGTELDILKTLPFDKFKIKTIVIEVRDSREGSIEIEKFLQNQGYELVVKRNVPIDAGFVDKLIGVVTEAIAESEYHFFQLVIS